MKQQEQLLVVVLGMHRSGTSAIARALPVLGVELGERLMPAAVDNNEKGFFEDLDVGALNIDLLSACDREWSDLVPIPDKVFLEERFAPFTSRAVELLREKLQGRALLGLKDPRLPILLPFWLAVFEQLKLRVAYVIALRNPLAVARSLAKRDRFSPEKSHYLWLQHILPCVLLSAGAPRVVVDYDRLMDAPAEQIGNMARALGLESRVDEGRLAEYQDEFLEERLRHTRFDADDFELDPLVPAPVRTAARLLSRVAAGALDLAAPEVSDSFEALSRLMAEMAPAMRCVMQAERVARVHEEAGRREALETEKLAARVAEQEAQIDRFALSLAARSEQLESLRQALVERDRQLAVQAEQARLRNELLQRWSIAE